MRHTLIAVAVVAAIVLSGCGGSEDSAAEVSETTATSEPTSEPPLPTVDPAVEAEAELKSAVVAYSDAFLTGKADAAYAIFSERCKDRMSEGEFAGIVGQAKNLYGSKLPLKSFHAQISDDLARVTYTYEVSAIDQDSEPWVREDGQWRQDDC